jgi:hypothetical protein
MGRLLIRGISTTEHAAIDHASVPLGANTVGAHASRHAAGGADAITSALSPSAIPCYKATPSDVLRGSNDTLDHITTTTYTKVRELTLGLVGGSIRVSFDLATAASATTGYGRVYVNDSPVGAEHSKAGTSFANFTDDISLPGFGARVQLYVRGSDTTNTVYYRNFRIYYDKTQLTSEVT